jgi:hypothetical protein
MPQKMATVINAQLAVMLTKTSAAALLQETQA